MVCVINSTVHASARMATGESIAMKVSYYYFSINFWKRRRDFGVFAEKTP